MKQKVKDSLISLMTAIQAGKIYSPEHPKFLEHINNAYLSLKEVLAEKAEFALGIVNDEIAWENEIFFDLSQKLRSLTQYLKERGIEKILIRSPLEEEELIHFISYLLDPESKALKDPQKYFDLAGIKSIKAGKITVSPSQRKKEIRKLPDLSLQHQSSIQELSRYVQTLLKKEQIDHLELKFHVFHIMKNFLGRHQEILNLVAVRKKDILTFMHLLNVAILAMHVASKMGFSKDDVLDIGIAALFHDIGKLSIAQQLLTKKDKLSDEEYSQMKDHASEGSRILLRYTDTLGMLPAVVAFEHHLRFDGRGYPKVPYSVKPHPVSLLVSVCDVYDALALKRSYKKDYPPLQIYEIMRKEKGHFFDPDLLDQFFKILGVWPVGTVVALTDKSIGIVREANEEDIFRPKIEVISPRKKKGYVDLKKESKDVQIVRSLNPYTEGKKYIANRSE